ncbi:MAG: protein-glutamate O-methyltransferase CheR [Acidobacteria bacterium]|nr:protein-glutamate O-methyltransferase CheR [Acidobacteriota bacterium]
MELPDDVFRKLRQTIYEKSGLWFSDNNKYLLQKRLSTRARQLNFDSFQKYFYFLAYDPAAAQEFDRVFELVTTNETYFFRESHQLDAFIHEIVPEMKAGVARGRKMRVWSAGCSSGEEAYTIAMLLDLHGWYDKGEFEVFGSDLSQTMLSKARTGVYRATSFRSTPPELKARYFEDVANESWRVRDEIRNRVSFGRLNLYESNRVALLGALDVIFCRNVIIYFNESSKKVVISNLRDRLIDGGYLLLGHSESLIALSTQFKLRHLKHDMVYQK